MDYKRGGGTQLGIRRQISLTEQQHSQVLLGSRGDYGGVARLEWLGLASTLRVVAVVVVAQLSDARGGCGSARTVRAQREVQLALRNNYYISRATQIPFI